MKRSLGPIVTCLLIFSGCASPEPEPAEPPPDPTEVEALERQMWDYFQARQFDNMLARMTGDFLMHGPDGILERALWRARASQQECEFEGDPAFDNMTTHVLAPTVVLISYRGTATGTCDGEEITPEIDSSVWIWTDGEWLATSHHWTPFVEESGE